MNRSYRKLTILCSGLMLAAGMLAAPAADGARDVLFELQDPRGDDHGNGRLIYPLRTDYEKGDLDLLSLRARRVAGGTEFEATFAKPIRVPGREAVDDLGTQLAAMARHGFYTFNLDIYIDTDRQEGSGAAALMPGRKALVREENAWDRAIILTPRPGDARAQLERLMIRSLAEESNREAEGEPAIGRRELRGEITGSLADRVYFPNRVRVRGRTVRFFVPDSFLRGPAQESWSYVVAVSGADLIQSLDLAASVGLADSRNDNLMVLPVSPGTWRDRFGGGLDDQDLEPPLVDIIVPPGTVQEEVLRDFSSREDRPARLPGVVPSELER